MSRNPYGFLQKADYFYESAKSNGYDPSSGLVSSVHGPIAFVGDFGDRPKCHDRPIKCCDRPIECRDRPIKCRDRPIERHDRPIECCNRPKFHDQDSCSDRLKYHSENHRKYLYEDSDRDRDSNSPSLFDNQNNYSEKINFDTEIVTSNSDGERFVKIKIDNGDPTKYIKIGLNDKEFTENLTPCEPKLIYTAPPPIKPQFRRIYDPTTRHYYRVDKIFERGEYHIPSGTVAVNTPIWYPENSLSQRIYTDPKTCQMYEIDKKYDNNGNYHYQNYRLVYRPYRPAGSGHYIPNYVREPI